MRARTRAAEVQKDRREQGRTGPVDPASGRDSIGLARGLFTLLALCAAVALGTFTLGAPRGVTKRQTSKAEAPRSFAEPARPSTGSRASAPATPPLDSKAEFTAATTRFATTEVEGSRLDRAEELLENYRSATRYPPDARPLAERPDMQRPHSVPTRTLPLARDGQAAGSARVTLRQDRYFAVGDEQVTMSILCQRGATAVPCGVVSSQAVTPSTTPEVAGPVPVVFREDGTDGDGAVTARFQPKDMGFSSYFGPIRVEVELRIGGESGSASFDLEYTPSPPAWFTGKVREAMVDGSLELYPSLHVKEPGRYVFRARVDDADGKPLAFLTENDVFESGEREVKLRLFGKLVRDQHARAPLRLRDVEGFLLKEDVYPDRKTVPGLDGLVYTTSRHSEAEFSDAEWESPEKERHLQVLTMDMERAASRAGSGTRIQ